MIGSEFIEMMRQDIETVEANKHNLEAIVECMAAVIEANPNCNIDDDGTKPKTPQGCYKYLEDIARQKKEGNSYFMSPQESLKHVADYLGLSMTEASSKSTIQSNVVNLEDFL